MQTVSTMRLSAYCNTVMRREAILRPVLILCQVPRQRHNERGYTIGRHGTLAQRTPPAVRLICKRLPPTTLARSHTFRFPVRSDLASG